MIEKRRLKNIVIFIQTILSFMLSRKIIHISILMLILIHKSRNSVLVIVQEYHNTKIKKIFVVWYQPNWTEKVFVIKQVKEYHGYMSPKNIKMRKIFKLFMSKSCRQKLNTKRKKWDKILNEIWANIFLNRIAI